MRHCAHMIIAATSFSMSGVGDDVLGGEETSFADEGPSGDANAGNKKDEGTGKETLDDDSDDIKALTVGSQAKYMFKSAIKETLQIKKMDSRDTSPGKKITMWHRCTFFIHCDFTRYT